MAAIIVSPPFHKHLYSRTGLWILGGRGRGSPAVLGNRSKQFFLPWRPSPGTELRQERALPAFRLIRVKTMAQCNSLVFFPDDPRLPPQFNDCPRQALTTRRTVHSVMKLCSMCAKVWDEQDAQIFPSRSNRTTHHRSPNTCRRTSPCTRFRRRNLATHLPLLGNSTARP